MNASVNLIEIFIDASFLFFCLIRKNSSMSGCEQSSPTISAARRPFCPIVPPVTSKIFRKLTAPVEVNALLFTRAPFGRSCEMSMPQPPP